MHNQQIERSGGSRHEVDDLVILNQEFITPEIHSFVKVQLIKAKGDGIAGDDDFMVTGRSML